MHREAVERATHGLPPTSLHRCDFFLGWDVFHLKSHLSGPMGGCKEATMLATATIPHAEAENPSTILPVVRVEYTNVEDFLVDYTSNETIGGMFIKSVPWPLAPPSRCESSAWRPMRSTSRRVR